MKVGLFFGSFNPIHVGHLVIAGFMANFTGLDKVWLIVSPHNPLKNKTDLINAYDRLEMARLATDEVNNIAVSDIEFSLPRPSYTIDTLSYLKERYPEYEFCLIMGEDNLKSFKKWKNYELILRDYTIFVYPRPGSPKSELSEHPSITITSTPQMEISATFIRKAIANGKSVRYFVPDTVLEFIEKKGLYAKDQ